VIILIRVSLGRVGRVLISFFIVISARYDMIKTKKYVIKEEAKAAAQPRTRKVKNWQGKTFNSGFVKSIMLHDSTHSKLSAICPKDATFEKLILKMISVLSEEGNGELLKKVTNYKFYRKMKA